MREEELVKVWQARIKAGIRFREVYGKEEDWDKYKQADRNWFAQDVHPVNVMFSVGRSYVPRVYFRNPQAIVTSLQPGHELHAKMIQAIDNHIIREIGLKKQMKKMVRHSFFGGVGIAELGYDSEFGFSPELFAPAAGEEGYYEEFEEVSGTQFDKKGKRIEYNANVKLGYPWALSVSPTMLVVPWGTQDEDNLMWYAHELWRPLADVKADWKYKRRGGKVQELKATGIRDDAKSPYGNILTNVDQRIDKNDLEWVQLWQIRDAKDGKVRVISLDHPRFLRDDVDYLQIEGLPVEFLIPNDDVDFFWGIPDARIVYNHQLTLNEVYTLLIKHMRSALTKWAANKDMIDDVEINKLTEASVRAVLKVKGDPAKALREVTAHIPPDLVAFLEVVHRALRETIGFSRVEMGEHAGPPRKTKYEVQAVQVAHHIRIDERRDNVADLFVNILRKINQIIFLMWTRERVVPIVGSEGARYWISYTGEELKGEYLIRVDPESGRPISLDKRKSDALELLSIVAGDQTATPEERAEIKRFVYSQYEGINLDKVGAGFRREVGGSPERPMEFGEAQWRAIRGEAPFGGMGSGAPAPAGTAPMMGIV